jgi:hypothetical protein
MSVYRTPGKIEANAPEKERCVWFELTHLQRFGLVVAWCGTFTIGYRITNLVRQLGVLEQVVIWSLLFLVICASLARIVKNLKELRR